MKAKRRRRTSAHIKAVLFTSRIAIELSDGPKLLYYCCERLSSIFPAILFCILLVEFATGYHHRRFRAISFAYGSLTIEPKILSSHMFITRRTENQPPMTATTTIAILPFNRQASICAHTRTPTIGSNVQFQNNNNDKPIIYRTAYQSHLNAFQTH